MSDELCYSPGFYIKLTKVEEKPYSILMPYAENFSISNKQKTVRPVEQFLKELKEFILTNADVRGGKLPAIVDMASSVQDLFGFHLGSKWYYASAWAGEEPATFSINLKFYRGLKNEWDAEQEVYLPMLNLYKKTIPAEYGKLLISSPMTTPAQAFSEYTTNIIGGVADSIVKIVDAGTSMITNVLGGLTGGAVKEVLDVSSKSQKIGSARRTWIISFGWCDGSAKSFKSYYDINNCICETSSISFGTQVQKENKDAQPFPVSGEIKLSFISETIMTDIDIVAKPSE